MAKSLLLWLLMAAVLMTVFSNFSNQQEHDQELSYDAMVKSIRQGQVMSVEIAQDRTVRGKFNDARNAGFSSSIGIGLEEDFYHELEDSDVQVTYLPPAKESILHQILIASFPILIIIAVFMFFMRQMQGGSSGRGGPMAFGKSKAKLLGEDQIKVTFADVAGVEEAKEEVQELVEFLRDPDRFQRLGGRIPKGVLMMGQPGTGKTLLAKAIAGEAKVPFFSISGSDFVEMFVGVGASRVRDMFDQAKRQSPCIIFIDEIDAVGRHRGAGLGGGHDEREQTLNQLLVEMDGFDVNDGVIVIAATNRPDVLDPALLRPGRFDRQVVVGLPDIRGRENILKVHMRKVPLDKDVKPELIARGTPGMAGADLANLVNEAALFAARAGKRLVGMNEFELAKDKILMGAERRSMVMNEDEKINTAYHEAGHAIVGHLMPDHDPVYKVTIIPRGRALGVTMNLPEEDRYSYSKRYLESKIASMMGGRIAEELILGKDGVTTGASNDIRQATEMARNMVTKWGLSEKMGPLMYDDADDSQVFIGMSAGSQSNPLSAHTAKMIDEEVRRIVDECYRRAEDALQTNMDKLHAMKDALMEYETLDAEQIKDIMAGKKPRPPADKGGEQSGNMSPEPDPSPSPQPPNQPGPIGGPASEH